METTFVNLGPKVPEKTEFMSIFGQKYVKSILREYPKVGDEFRIICTLSDEENEKVTLSLEKIEK